MKKSLFGFIWQCAKPYKFYLLLAFLAPLMSGFYELLTSYTVKLIIDTFSSSEHVDYDDFIYPMGIFIGMQIISEILWRVGGFTIWRSIPYIKQKIVEKSYDYVQHHAYSFFQKNPTGSIVSKLKGLIDNFDTLFVALRNTLLVHVSNLLILVFSLLSINLSLFVFIAIWIFMFCFITWQTGKRLNDLSYTQTASKHALFGIIGDNIGNIFSILSFATRKHETKKIDKFISHDYTPKQVRLFKFSFIAALINGIMYMVMISTVFAYLIYLRKNNLITMGDVAFAAMIMWQLGYTVWDLTGVIQEFIKNIGDFKSSYDILALSHENLDKPTARKLKISGGEIEFNNVNFAYNKKKPILHNLSLKIKAGERIGIVGLSGAGKSSLISILLKYFPYNSGSISIDGQDITEITSDSLRSNISLIPQDTTLFHCSISENIHYGNLDAYKDEIYEAAKKANIHDSILELEHGYDTIAGEKGARLSGGQRQRIAIARAILKNAPILILDEATSSLDTVTENLIQKSINDMLDNSKATVIAIAHRLSTLKHMDRIIVLHKGQVAEEGSHDQLIANKNSLYSKLWKMQQI